MAGVSYNGTLKYIPGSTAGDDALEILLVSSSQLYLDQVQENLYITRQIQADKRTYNLKVHTCKQVEDVLNLASDEFTVDFIAFILDVNNKGCFNEVSNNMNLLNSSFRKEKMCFVYPNPGYGKSGIQPLAVWNFATKEQINLITGKTDQGRMTNLSKSILNLAEACCGKVTGVPLVGFV